MVVAGLDTSLEARTGAGDLLDRGQEVKWHEVVPCPYPAVVEIPGSGS